MCSIMGYCSPSADHDLFKEGFDRTISRGPDDSRIVIDNGVCKLADHSALVGSIATSDQLIRTMVEKAKLPLEDAIRMASETPARLMGVYDRVGSLQKGKDADVLIIDRKLNVRQVWCKGQVVVDAAF